MNEHLERHRKMVEPIELKTRSVKDINSMDFGEETWTIDKLIPEQSITAITGAPDTFKTWLTLEIAKSVSSGQKFLGTFDVDRSGVLFIDKENHLKHIKKRLQALGVTDGPLYYLDEIDKFFLDNTKQKQGLIKLLKQKNAPKLVVFDSFVRIHTGNENDAQYVSKIMGIFREITNLGATVIFIHHNRKERADGSPNKNSLRGSSDILAGLDCLLQITKPDNECLYVKQSKLRQAEALEEFRVNILKDEEKETLAFQFAGEESPKEIVSRKIQDVIAISLDGQSKSRQELVNELKELGHSIPSIDRALKNLEYEGIIQRTVGAHNKHYYSLRAELNSINKFDEEEPPHQGD